jgi:sugar phosphate isomerase/epimerase
MWGGAALTRGAKGLARPPGLQTYSVRREMAKDLEGALETIRELGFTELETPGAAGMRPEQFRKRLDAAGLKATSTHTGWEQFAEDTKRIIGNAQALGAKYVMCPGIPHKSVLTMDDCQLAITSFNNWGEQFRAAGIRFVYHPHGPEFQPSPDGTLLDTLAKGMKPGIADFEMDTFWFVWPGQDPVAFLNKYRGRSILMHLKDLQKGAKGDLNPDAPESVDVPVGTGQVDWPAVFRAAKGTVEHYFIEDGSADPVAHIRQSLHYLRSQIVADTRSIIAAARASTSSSS